MSGKHTRRAFLVGAGAVFFLLVFVLPGVAHAIPIEQVVATGAETENGARLINLWEFCRSLVNWGLVALLVVTALANILHFNIDTYGVKKVLPSLLIAFFLANFSLFITRTILDIAASLVNTADTISVQATGTTVAWAIVNAGKFSTLLAAIIAAVAGFVVLGPVGVILGVLVGIVLIFFPAIAMLLLYLMAIVRHYVLLYLIALSPLAFFAMGTPFTQKWFQKWWGMFITWAFLKAVGMFILVAGAIVLHGKLGGDLVSYVIAIAAMWAAVTVPFSMGGAIMSQVAKLSGGAIKSPAQGLFNRAMSNSTIANSRAGKIVSQVSGGLAAYKQREADRARLAQANIKGEATDALRTRERIGVRQWEDLRSGDPARYAVALASLNPLRSTQDRLNMLNLQESRFGRDAAKAAEEAEVAKTLPKDKNRQLNVFSEEASTTGRRILYKELTRNGGLEQLVGRVQQEAVEANGNAAAAARFAEKYGFNTTEAQSLDFKNNEQMTRLSVAILGSDAQRNRDLASGATDTSTVLTQMNNDNRTDGRFEDLFNDMNEWAEAAFSNGGQHLGKILDKRRDGRAQVIVDTTARVDASIGKLMTGEKQNVAKQLRGDIWTDPANLARLAANPTMQAGNLIPHKDHIDRNLKDALRAADPVSYGRLT